MRGIALLTSGCPVVLLVALIALATTNAAQDAAPREQILFDEGWQFHLGEVSGAQQPAMQITTWRRIALPHDWSAEAEFSKTNASCTAYLPGGIGWYRKSFETQPAWAGRKVFVTFDGVYRNAAVWINGHALGQRPYGYSTFQHDLTPFLAASGPNILAVRVERENTADSRFYTGSGIYRHVWLTVCDPVHVLLWGNYVTTPRATAESADVVVRTEVTNETSAAQSVRVKWQILTPEGQPLEEKSQSQELPPGGEYTFSLWQKVPQPRLWSPDTPALYTMISRVFVEGVMKDETRTPFGIRSFWFDANQGFFLNGKNLKIKGLCIHHDAGVVGAAVPEDVLARRLKLVKEIGGNAVRCSHNPMAPEFYDLCDQLGLLVMDEAFDEWEIGKRKWVEGRNVGSAKRFGYSADFSAWAERDCTDMVQRDRNHPSIILWSIGNEIDYPTDPYVLSETRTVEGFAQDSKQPQQTRLAVVAPKLIAAVKRQDPTRPVTMALANGVSSDATGLAEMLDVVGYNYQERDYEKEHRLFPTRVIMGSENGVGLPQWKAVADNPFISSQFLWVGFDFLGEAGPWPNHGSQAGLFDTRGFKKTSALQHQAMWSATPVVALLVRAPPQPGEERFRRGRFDPHWTWPDDIGRLRVMAFSNCERVELRLNGRSLESKPIQDDLSATFEVDYQRGELSAIGYRGDTPVATNTLISAGKSVALRLEADRTTLPADGQSVAHVIASVVDQQGNLVHPARDAVTMTLEGGRLLGVDNGDLNDVTALSSPTKQTRGGRVLALVQAPRQPGKLTVKAEAPGMRGATLILSAGK
jgi:beta-galactosidase